MPGGPAVGASGEGAALNQETLHALTVHQPWASEIIAGTKTAEHRSWRSPHRGHLYIHAGAPPSGDLITRAIVGYVTVVGCRWNTGRGEWDWILKDPVALARPVFCRGWPGIWEMTPELAEQVLAAQD
jgi:hypothetical protein